MVKVNLDNMTKVKKEQIGTQFWSDPFCKSAMGLIMVLSVLQQFFTPLGNLSTKTACYCKRLVFCKFLYPDMSFINNISIASQQTGVICENLM